MRKNKTRLLIPIVAGILLVAAGVVLLLNNLGIIVLDWGLLMGPLFGFGGLVFVMVFILNKEEWWALIPGFVLIAIGTITFGQQMDALAEPWGGTIFLGFIGLAFVLIYISHNEHWWAIIPGGVLLTLAGVNFVSDETALAGGAFFFGLALTFGLVYLLPKPSGRLNWALYPAGILLLVAIVVLLGATELLGLVWPLALLLAGAYVLYRAIRK